MRRLMRSALLVAALVSFAWCLHASSTHAAGALSFTLLGTHPDAAAQTTSTGKRIQKLEIFNNKLYIGYGDYGANTGPMKVNPYDLSTHAFTGSLWTFNTEQMSQFRILNGKIYAPSIDPTCGVFCAGGYAVGEPWSTRAPVNVVHVYDMATLNGTDLWMVGASDVGARAWRSTDGGSGWSTIQEDTSAVQGGYERYYWVASINGKIYMQANNTSPATPMRIFDGSTWTAGTTTQFANSERRVVVFKNKIIANNFAYLKIFDGTTMSEATYIASNYPDIYPDGDYLYAITSANTLARTSNLTNWEILGTIPTGSNALAVSDGYVYIGTTDSKIYSSPLPVADPVVVTNHSPSSVAPTTVSTSAGVTTRAAWVADTNLATTTGLATAEATASKPNTTNGAPVSEITKIIAVTKKSKSRFIWYIGLGGFSVLLFGIIVFLRF